MVKEGWQETLRYEVKDEGYKVFYTLEEPGIHFILIRVEGVLRQALAIFGLPAPENVSFDGSQKANYDSLNMVFILMFYFEYQKLT